MPDVVQGEWETREVYLVGGRLSPSESAAVARYSAHGFGWGDSASGAAQLALALLLCATDRASAVAHYRAFKWGVIARPPQADSLRQNFTSASLCHRRRASTPRPDIKLPTTVTDSWTLTSSNTSNAFATIEPASLRACASWHSETSITSRVR